MIHIGRRYIWIYLLISVSLSFSAAAQTEKVSGTLLEKGTDRPMAFTNIQNLQSRAISITDTLGRFSISAEPFDTLAFSFIGYENLNVLAGRISTGDTLRMVATSTVLREVKVEGDRARAIEQFNSIRSGMNSLGKDVVFELPAIAGEPDFVKVITLLPGASKGVEGSNDFFIRGGAADQNLVLFDGATVYNTGHLFGFLSVFNPSVVGEVNMMTGGFPAEYGGRLSSIIDIRSKDIQKDAFFMEGGIGLISSRVSAEVPIVKDKLAVQIAGRRTYADKVVALVGSELPYYFYDVNFNADYQLTPTARLKYGFYMGDDVLNYDGTRGRNNDPSGTSFVLGNQIQTLTLNKDFGNIYSETGLSFTRFDYTINNYYQDNRLDVDSDIADLRLQQKLTIPISNRDKIHAGASSTLRTVNTSLVNVEGELAEVIPDSEGEQLQVLENAVFGEWEFKRGALEGIVGARVSGAFLPNRTYWQPEPRIALRYALSENLALKASYTRMAQYIHRVSSSSFALPTDVWYPVDDFVRPQTADQWTLGINRFLQSKDIVIGLEAYYKRMQNLVEFREGTSLVLNPEFRDGLLQGDGSSYGVEVLARKDLGRFRGWLSYTASWTQRQFDELNQGFAFAARYDRRHNTSVVGNYQLNDRWTFSAVWEFISGARFTPTIGYYGVPNASATGVDLIPIFPERNSVKLADTHRLDISVIFKGKTKPGKRWRGDWHFSIYNVYNRSTPIAIDISYDETSDTYQYEQPGLIGLLPSITYNFTFL